MRNYYKDHFTKGEIIWPIAYVPAPDGTDVITGTLIVGTGSAGTGYDRYVYDLTAGERASAPATAIDTIEGGNRAEVMQGAVTTGGHWKKGGIGYTFRDQNGVDIPTPVGAHTYRIVYLLNTTDFGAIPLVWDMTCDGHEAAPA